MTTVSIENSIQTSEQCDKIDFKKNLSSVKNDRWKERCLPCGMVS